MGVKNENRYRDSGHATNAYDTMEFTHYNFTLGFNITIGRFFELWQEALEYDDRGQLP